MTFDELQKHLGGTPRWPAFQYLISRLLDLKRPVRIVETGTMREDGNWSGDGQSTRVWEMICEATQGRGLTIDIDPKACTLAKTYCRRMSTRTQNSHLALMQIDLSDTDLLFLDSYDYTGDGRSELHHVGELALAYPRIPSGCLIAVDDCHGEYNGKHSLVKRFFELIRVNPVHVGYITIWEKP